MKTSQKAARKPVGKQSAGKKRLWRIAFIALIIAAGLFAVILVLTSQNEIVLSIDGIKMQEREYRWAMFSARDDVLGELNTHGISPVYWDRQTDWGMPYEMVAERAVDILREYYAISSLGVECGYLEDAGFGALENQIKDENERRAEAIAKGEIFTGLSRYDLNQYIQYRAGGIRRQYCDDGSNPGMDISEEEMRRQYEENKDFLYVQQDSLELRYIEIYTDSLDLSGDEIAELEKEIDALRQSAVELESLEEAMEQAPNLQAYYQALSINNDNYAAYAKSSADLLHYADSLQTGDISEVIRDMGWIFLIECVERTENGYMSFESLTGSLERSVRERKYDALIEARTARIEAVYDAGKLYRYTKKQLG